MKKKYRVFFLLILSLLLICSLSSCGKGRVIKGEGTVEKPWLVGKDKESDVQIYLDGTSMTVTGTGAILDFESPMERPWHNDVTKITLLEIDSGITGIGDYSFMNLGGTSDSLTVFVGNSIQYLGKSAFDGANFPVDSFVRFPATLEKLDCRALASTTPAGFIFYGKPVTDPEAFEGAETEIHILVPDAWPENDRTDYGGRLTYLNEYLVIIHTESLQGENLDYTYVPEGETFELDASDFLPDYEGAAFHHYETIEGNMEYDSTNPVISFIPEGRTEIKVVFTRLSCCD